jgi:hypothetical protein
MHIELTQKDLMLKQQLQDHSKISKSNPIGRYMMGQGKSDTYSSDDDDSDYYDENGHI